MIVVSMRLRNLLKNGQKNIDLIKNSHTGSNPVKDSKCWYRWFIFDTVFTLDDVSAIVCVIARRETCALVECYNLKKSIGISPHSFESCRRLKMFGGCDSTSEMKKTEKGKMYLTPTWFEHATFWSGVRRATVAPRSRWKLLFEITTLSINRYRPIR